MTPSFVKYSLNLIDLGVIDFEEFRSRPRDDCDPKDRVSSFILHTHLIYPKKMSSPSPPRKSSPDRGSKSRTANELGLEEAEEGLIRTVERRRSRVSSRSGEDWHASVDGERPPLGENVSFDKMYKVMMTSEPSHNSSVSGGEPVAAKDRLRSIVRKVNLVNKMVGTPSMTHNVNTPAGGAMSSATSVSSLGSGSGSIPVSSARHRRHVSQAQALLECIQETTDETASVSRKAPSTSDKSSTAIFEGVGENPVTTGESGFSVEATDTDRLVTGAMEIEKLFQQDDKEEEQEVLNFEDIAQDAEGRPLLGRDDPSYQSMSVKPSGRFLTKPRLVAHRRWVRWRRNLKTCCHPMAILRSLRGLCFGSFAVTLGLCAYFLSLGLFYVMGNPEFDFLPGQATLAWWLNFFSRQCVTLDIARVMQWLVIDKFLLGTRAGVQVFGPLASLTLIQSRGYPFVLFAWAVTNLFVLHGNQPFSQHWLTVTRLRYYLETNSGNYVLTSDIYFRLLLSMVAAGVAKACKRTGVALYFGRRTFAEFKPRMERILKDIVLLSEVAALAEEIDRVVTPTGAIASDVELTRDGKARLIGDQVTWGSTGSNAKNKVFTSDVGNVEDEESECLEDEFQLNQSKSERTTDMKALLDDWTEPVDKSERSINASIDDILRFRRALSFMDDAEPFGVCFGPASSRDEFLVSAEHVFKRLLKTTPDQNCLCVEVLDMLVEDEDGAVTDCAKKKALYKMFRPNAENELSLLAFLQSCDAVYRNLRFFRASVGNASIIDHALERIVDGFFNFLLALALLTIMRFNPWPLLVSVSTLLVSVSFAVSSSCSNFIEGLLMICLRRPFGESVHFLALSST